MEYALKITHFARWVVSLNNGETIVEDTGNFKEVEGEISPWRKLDKYIDENGLKITSLAIQKNGNIYNLPSQNPKFGGQIPFEYAFERKAFADVTSANGASLTEGYSIITAFYKGSEGESVKVQQIVDDTERGKGAWVKIE